MTLGNSTLENQREHTLTKNNNADVVKPVNPDSSDSKGDELEDMLVRMHQQRAQRRLSTVPCYPEASRTGSATMSEAAASFARIKWRQAPVDKHHSSGHAKIESGSM